TDPPPARAAPPPAAPTLVPGRCHPGGPTGPAPARPASAAGAGGAGYTQGGCAAITNANVFPTVVVLPVSVAGQAACGQRVAVSAMSAGDLVFWDFRDNAPTRVGVAVGGAQLVTVEPGTGQAVQQFVPANADVRVKRVLRGAA
uniref:NlpC/P60 family protein n=1 Tax=Nocardia wallacei TaxID=480035 RepID=UPI00313C6648